MNKKAVLVIGFIMVAIVSTVTYRAVDRWQYKNSFQTVNLKQMSCQYFDMTKKQTPFWIYINNRQQYATIQKIYNLELPETDFEKEMLIISFGSQLESLKFNSKEPSYKTRKKYIGFPCFKQENSINAVYVYVTEKIPIMGTDEAGFPPDYRGKY